MKTRKQLATEHFVQAMKDSVPNADDFTRDVLGLAFQRGYESGEAGAFEEMFTRAVALQQATADPKKTN